MQNNSESFLESKKRNTFVDGSKKQEYVSEGAKASKKDAPENKAGESKHANSDIVFLGVQRTPSGKAVPLYNIMIKNHPLYQSTVTEETLRKYNLQAPQVPRAFNNKREGSGPQK